MPPAGLAVPSAVMVSMLMRACSAVPRGAGIASCVRSSRSSVRPPAISSWMRTRSSPVTSSVTVCSTCSRALASMKAKSPRLDIDQKFDGAEALYFAASPSAHGGLEQLLADASRNAGGRRDLDQLLALALQVHSRSHRCETAPVPSPTICTSTCRACAEQPLDIEIAIAERRLGFGGAALIGRVELFGAGDRPHAAPAAAGHRLQHDRRRPSRNARASSSVVAPSVPASTGTSHSAASARAGALSPNSASVSGSGPTKISPALAQALGERRVLAQESHSRDARVAAGLARRRDHAAMSR